MRFSRGVWSGLNGGTPEHAYDALNIFHHGTSAVGRDGAEALEVIAPSGEVAYTGTSATVNDDPAAVATGAVALGTNDFVLWVGASAPWNLLALDVDVTALTYDADAVNWPSFLTVEYWNGTAWVVEAPARLWQPEKWDGGTDFSYTPFPLVLDDDGALGTGASLGIKPYFSAVEPSDWAAKTVATQSKYWRRISGWPVAPWRNSTGQIKNAYAQLTERRIIHINPFNTRTGGPNLFKVMVTEDGTQLHYYLNGTELSQGVALSSASASVKFDANTEVWSTYVPAINKVIGRVLGFNWFVFSPTTGVIDVLPLTGDTTAYASLDQGLRTALPPGSVAFLFDGRLVMCDGNQVVWTAPDVFVDVAPNEFERFIQNGDGVITCACPAKTWAAIFTQSACYRMISDGTSDGFLVEKMLGGVGALGRRCATAVGDTVFFMGADGIYQMSGSGDVGKMSVAIDEIFRGATLANRARSTLIYHAALNQLRLFMCSNEESVQYDIAFYGCGVPVQFQGESGEDPSWWPQGRKLPTHYGFAACCVVMDEREPVPRMLVGDPYGVIWEHDVGQSDCGPPVYRRLLSAPMNVGTSQDTTVRWVNVALGNTGDVTLNVKVLADMNEQKADVQSQDVYVSADVRVVDAITLIDATSTFKGEDRAPIMECSFESRCRVVQVGIEQEEELALDLASIEIRANAQGRLGGR